MAKKRTPKPVRLPKTTRPAEIATEIEMAEARRYAQSFGSMGGGFQRVGAGNVAHSTTDVGVKR